MDSNLKGGNNINTVQIQDALIEEISLGWDTGYLLISHGETRDSTMTIKLIVGQDTTIEDQTGQRMRFQDLKGGMRIDAVISAAMTASIPPQAKVFHIVVLEDRKLFEVKEGRVVEVDVNNCFFIIGDKKDINKQIRFNVSNNTVFLSKRGNRIGMGNVRVGQMVKVQHALFMTFSIPPQTLAYRVQIL